MPAYWIARSRIIDPVEYKKYTDLVPDIIARYGGRVLARPERGEVDEALDWDEESLYPYASTLLDDVYEG